MYIHRRMFEVYLRKASISMEFAIQSRKRSMRPPRNGGASLVAIAHTYTLKANAINGSIFSFAIYKKTFPSFLPLTFFLLIIIIIIL